MVVLQGISYNMNIDINQFDKTTYCHLNTYKYPINKKYGISNFSLCNNFYLNEKEIKTENKDNKLIVIFRDPIKRYLSALHTESSFFYGETINNSLNEIENFIKKGGGLMDQHFFPQSCFFNFDDVDIFVNLENYTQFCGENNIPWIMANKNISKNYLNLSVTDEQKEKIKLIYESDYEMIEKINKSNKLWIPQNNI